MLHRLDPLLFDSLEIDETTLFADLSSAATYESKGSIRFHHYRAKRKAIPINQFSELVSGLYTLGVHGGGMETKETKRKNETSAAAFVTGR